MAKFVFIKNLHLTLPGDTEAGDILPLVDICNDFIMIKPTQEGGDIHLYCNRNDGKKFNFRTMNTLAKLLPAVNSADIQVVRAAYTDRMPDTFFRDHLDVNRALEDQILLAKGRFEDFSLILANIQNDVKKRQNRTIRSSVESKGVLETYKDGLISAGEVKPNMAVQDMIKEKAKAKECKEKDIPYGKFWGFQCLRTGQEHHIESYKADASHTPN